MDQKYYQTKQFLSLKSAWYGKLKKFGFKDIEKDEHFLHEYSKSRTSTGNNAAQNTPVKREAKQDYYRYANFFTSTSKFKRLSRNEKKIWRLHLQGLGTREIAKRLNKQNSETKTNKDKINSVTMAIKKEMFNLYGINTKR